jgi:hypothetical protein
MNVKQEPLGISDCQTTNNANIDTYIAHVTFFRGCSYFYWFKNQTYQFAL